MPKLKSISIVALTCLFASVVYADIVINEIHYAPANKTDHTEFVELYNNSSNTLDLTSWRISGGIDYLFPSNTTVAAYGYLVVSEDPAAISNNFSIVSLGAFSGYLNNDGERVRLRNAADAVVDEVDYSLAFPWPTDSSGEGSSMELIHPSLDNNLGGSWRASGYPANGTPTPGQQNSVWSTNAPPQPRQVEHFPKQPTTTNAITVTIKATDPNTVDTVELAYQIVMPGAYIPAWLPLERDSLMNTPNTTFAINPDFTNAANWTAVSMHDDGIDGDETANDNIYSVTLPAQPTNRTLLRYRITASDLQGNSATFPYDDDPSLNFACFIYNGVPDYTASNSVYGTSHTYSRELLTSLPVYHLLTPYSELMHSYAYSPAYSSWQIPASNEDARDKFNWEGAFVYDGIVHDHIRYRGRQRNDRYFGYGKRSMRFRFNKGHYLQTRDQYGRKTPEKWRTLNTGKMSRYNSSGNFGLTEHLNQMLWNLVDVPSSTTHHFHFRIVDGIDEAPGGTDGQYQGDFHGYGFGMEDYDSRFMASRDFPDGNMYKLKDGVSDFSELQRNQGRHAVTDGSDFNNIRNNLRPERDTTWLEQHVDYDNWYPYHAICEAVRHYDFDISTTHFKNRVWFFEPVDGNPLGRLQVLPHDSDASWIRGYHDGITTAIGIDYPKQAIFDYGGSGPNAKPTFKQKYRNAIREIRDLLWREDVIEPMIDDIAQRLQNFSNADRDRWKDAPADAGYQDFGPMEDQVTAMKNFAFVEDLIDGASFNGGRAAYLDQLANAEGDAENIPDTPVITYAGISNYPLNGLTFSCTPFSDPQGTNTYAAMRWRVGEITDITAPGYDPDDLPRHEIVPVWQTGVMTNFTANITVPSVALKVGHTYRARVRMQDATGRWSHWSAPHQFTTGEPDTTVDLLAGLRLTELMFHPQNGDNEFIELQNQGTNTLDLTGIIFTSGIDFTFGNLTLEPGEFTVIVRDLLSFSQAYNTNIMLIAGEYSGKLSNDGEQLKLRTAASGTTIISFEYESGRGWPLAADGAGHSIVPLVMDNQLNALDYGGNWHPSTLIGGSPCAADLQIARSVVINEFAAHTDYDTGEPWQDSNDWIELFNASTNATAFDSNWYLSDSDDNLKKWNIPPGTLLANSWLTFFEVGGFHPSTNSGFGLNKSGESIFLSYLPDTAEDRIVDCLRFKAQNNGETEGRYVDGTDQWHTLSPTTNAANAIPLPHIAFDEIMYHPEPATGTLEYVELYNPQSVTVSLWREESLAWDPDWYQTWRLDGGIDYTFPTNTTIAPGERILMVAFDPADNNLLNQFLETYGITNTTTRFFGPYTGQLSDRGERIALEQPVAPDQTGETTSWKIVDEVIYFDRAPWSPDADGGGRPLQRAAATGYGNDPAVWNAALISTPGLAPVKIAIVAPADNTIFVLPTEIEIRSEVDERFTEGDIAHVEFLINGESTGIITSPPYNTTFTPDYSNAIYRLQAILVDDAGSQTSETARISIYTNRPVANAGDNRILNATAYNAINLAGAVDPNGLPIESVNSSWQLLSGSGTVWFEDNETLDTEIRFSAAGDYLLGLITSYGEHCMTQTVQITVQTTNYLNSIPYEESFEQYDIGRTIVGINGWSTLAQTKPLITYEGSSQTSNVPIIDAFHQQSLAITENILNKFETNSQTHVWLDLLLTAKLTDASKLDNTGFGQFAVIFNTTGNAEVWQASGGSNNWLELSDVAVTNGQWVRVTIHADYTGITNRFNLWIDGTAVTNPTTFFTSADQNKTGFEFIEFQGSFKLDDLVVDDYDLLNYRKVTTASHGQGSISPGSEVLVPIGDDADFTLTASNYYHTSVIEVDSTPIWTGAVSQMNYSLSNVISRRCLDTWFDENLATNQIPEWWLASMHPTWTNAFDSHALADYDLDGMPTWAEYIAGTHPTNSEDVLQIKAQLIITNGTPAVALSWDTYTGREYALYATTNLTPAAWQPIYQTNTADRTVHYIENNTTSNRFYKVGVNLEP